MDAHARPPDALKAFYKKYQKLKGEALDIDQEVLNLDNHKARDGVNLMKEVDYHQGSDDRNACQLIADFLASRNDVIEVFELESIPGLQIIPNLLPPSSQLALLDKLLHRDLSRPEHLSNLHLHYKVGYPPGEGSFFSLPAKSTNPLHHPKDETIHKPINVQQMLHKKLRWITLGGQYDWTNKVYPAGKPPDFPADIANFLRFLFRDMMRPEAAILNFYSPGDTLSLHRDVAEECNRGLISLSLGCDGIFILGLEDRETNELKMSALRLHSGDAVFMDGPSRYAWHGVPQIVAGTCPEWLRDWPGKDYPEWKGWMDGKRINLNVRQMWD